MVHRETHPEIRKNGARKASVLGTPNSSEAQSYTFPLVSSQAQTCSFGIPHFAFGRVRRWLETRLSRSKDTAGLGPWT